MRATFSERSVGLWLVLLLALPSVGCRRSVPPAVSLPEVVDSGRLTQTRVVATPEAPLEGGKNTVFCGTFQLAWNALREQMGGQAIAMEGKPALAEGLNAGTFSKNELSEDAYLAIAGKVADGVFERIQEAMRTRFPEADLAPLPPGADTEVCVYAYLQKQLPFQEVFDRLESPLEFHAGDQTVPVTAFGIDAGEPDSQRAGALQSQVAVLDYQSDDDFVIALRPRSDADEIVLAKVKPEATLAETIRAVQARAKPNDKQPDELHGGEPLAIPVVVLGVAHSYSELIGPKLQNKGWEGMSLTMARQAIRFRLDEAGARLVSDAQIAVTPAKPPRLRQFILDRPFLLYLKEKAATTPYLALWIANAELLEPAK